MPRGSNLTLVPFAQPFLRAPLPPPLPVSPFRDGEFHARSNGFRRKKSPDSYTLFFTLPCTEHRNVRLEATKLKPESERNLVLARGATQMNKSAVKY